MIRVMAFSLLFLLASSTSSRSDEQPQEHKNYRSSLLRASSSKRLLKERFRSLNESDDSSPTPMIKKNLTPAPDSTATTKECEDGKRKFQAGSYDNREVMTCKELRKSSPLDKNRICFVTEAWNECVQTCGRCVSDTDISPPLPITFVAKKQLPIFINCGGKNFKDSRGNQWIADAYFNTGESYSEIFWIFGTSDRNIYRSNRYDSKASKPDLTYDIPVVNGKYDVFLHFAELYSRAQTSGVRVFDVVVEGSMELPDFDIYAEAGGYTALVKQTTTTVKDGFLTIKFLGKLENPQISGIEIRPSSVPFIKPSGLSPAPLLAPSIKPSISPTSPPSLKPSLSPSANPALEVLVAPTEIPLLESQNADVPELQSRSTGPSVSPSSQSMSHSAQLSATQQLSATGGNSKVFGTVKAENGKLLDDISIALLDINENVVATTMSGPEGKYHFTDFTPGIYFVETTYPTDNPYIISVNVDYSAVAPQTASSSAIMGSGMPSISPSSRTSIDGSMEPSTGLSQQPSENSREKPYMASSDLPSSGPSQVSEEPPETSQEPSNAPFSSPSIEILMPAADSSLTTLPTAPPKASPTGSPTASPTASPTGVATILPTASPTVLPTGTPKASPTVLPTDTPTTPAAYVPFTPIYINAGGDMFTDSTNITWAADTYYINGGTFQASQYEPISGTENDLLYRSERYDDSSDALKYEIPVASGEYTTILHFAEISSRTIYVGARVFDVSLEGSVVFSSLDIFDEVGRGAAMRKSATIQVTDGILTIELIRHAGNPKISAIEVHLTSEAPDPPPSTPAKAFTPIYINSGGPAFIDSNGTKWAQDEFFNTGRTFATKEIIIGSTDQALFGTERYQKSDARDLLKYEIPVPDGNYLVTLHFADIFKGTHEIGGRVFNVLIEGFGVLRDLDIYAEVGPFAPLTKSIPTAVSDGALTIELQAVMENPKISAIAVEPLESVTTHHAHAVTGGPYFKTDRDGDNVASITVDGTFSHSHGLGASLVDWNWIVNDTQVGAGEIATFELPVGVHTLTLEVVDNFGDIASEDTTVTIQAFGHPDITSLSPDRGFFEGGERVLIAGSGFTAVFTDTIVHFGSVSLSGPSELAIVDENTIEVKKTPPSSSGSVQVWVETPLGESNVVPYRYIDEMQIAFSTGKIMSGISGPSCVAFGNDGKLYVGTIKGLIFKLTLDDNNDVIDTTVSNVVEESDTSLRSILGMAFDPMDTSPNPSLYVTHSSLFHKKLVSYNGKVSRVSGEKLDVIEHVVTGLPVSELDHAVNGLEFGDNGELYIQVGGNTNAGVPGALSSSGLMEDALFSSATLVAHLSRLGYDGNVEYDDTGDQISGFDVEIFATGQRNSFDITLHSNGHLYATDNGPNFSFGERSIDCSGTSEKDPSEGDELNLIVKDGYYGQANRKRGERDPRQCRWRSVSEPSDVDYTAPLSVLPSSTDGIVEFQTDHFGGKLRGHLIVGRYKGGLYDITLTSDGESVTRGASLLIEQGGIGVTQGPDGTLFVASHDAGEVLFHAPNEPSSLDLEVKSTFPRRGPQTGGSLLSVYGKNLDSAGVTVTVGDQACPISGSTRASKITCTLPSGSGTVDIVVATETKADALVGGYRYISGSE